MPGWTARTRVARNVAVWTAVLTLPACSIVNSSRAPEAGEDVEIQLGRELIDEYGCGTCHIIPGVRGADGLVGPPLTHMGRRAYVAGAITNTPENLAKWIVSPDAIEPGTAMPDLGVTPEQAAQIAAYLHTLD